mgnify:CR=1 FL=1
MEFRVLAVGDVVGAPGLRFLQQKLRGIRRLYGVDFCVVNGENANVVGITPQQADAIFDAGADVITLGNHTWNRREILPYLDECGYILRPANFLPSLPGRGWGIFETKAGPVAVVNLIGRCSMDFGPDNPFRVIDKILRDIGDIPVLIDFHAEATSEKLAMGYYLDGKISALWGTHTHVPTADEQVLPNGTGKTRLYPEAYRLGRAGGVCRAALAAGETVPAAQLIPDYHRLSQAERERAARLQAAP